MIKRRPLHEVLKEPRDVRPQKGAWAPGHYVCNCVKCNKGYIGDKRSVVCADCAYKEDDNE